MYKYFVENGNFKLPVTNFSDIKFKSNCFSIDKNSIHAEYPNGVALDVTITSDGAEIISNKEFIVDSNGNYVLKEEI